MKEISGSRETAKIIYGAHKVNLRSSDKENLGSGEQRAKFSRERGTPACRASSCSSSNLNLDLGHDKAGFKITEKIRFPKMYNKYCTHIVHDHAPFYITFSGFSVGNSSPNFGFPASFLGVS